MSADLMRPMLQCVFFLIGGAFPIIGSTPVADIEARHVVQCLKPIWLIKKETAKRVRQRIDAGELHAYVQQNVIQQSSGSQNPELQGDADRVLVRFQ